MRLWHYKLIQYLPKSQLLAQWRELNSIFKKEDKHILINYIYEYPKKDLLYYSMLVIDEMENRGYKVNKKNYNNYFDKFDVYNLAFSDNLTDFEPFKYDHTDRYLLQCFYNLQEKYDRGQKDFSKKMYEKLEKFVTSGRIAIYRAEDTFKDIIYPPEKEPTFLSKIINGDWKD